MTHGVDRDRVLRGLTDGPEPAASAEPAEPSVPIEPTPTDQEGGGTTPACRSDLRGWAGAHQHGAVRPRPRTNRRQRPPRRWC